MKRWLTILLFAAGGLATEVAHPAQCSLLFVGRLSRRDDGTRTELARRFAARPHRPSQWANFREAQTAGRRGRKRRVPAWRFAAGKTVSSLRSSHPSG
ncbi:hypothetical protein KGP95_17555 [Burkholderia multivorans]|uniref:hypothetical protein n=1 Tax=Burkholderia multivorans TaxID=87883 RepID=UPI00209DE951|nr:hypothetical protein [Burkholderia multivorans]MCO8612578.1 hypothetical protein [Burkholderia multivorans]MCO8639137.1 hypothetical protein [Burkholderia multivorans]